jgi:ABC-type glycerol-3-phosphate transport system permease component
MVLFLAGLAAIPATLYDAAAVDGRRDGWTRFWLVTWPMLGPTTLFVVIVTAANAFRVFETVATLTQGGPAFASDTIVYALYREGFVYFKAGYASAITVVFFLALLVLTALATRGARRAPGALPMSRSRDAIMTCSARWPSARGDPAALRLDGIGLAQAPRRDLHHRCAPAARSRRHSQNYWVALTETRIPLYLLNGVIVTGGILMLQLLVTVPCAYAWRTGSFPGAAFCSARWSPRFWCRSTSPRSRSSSASPGAGSSTPTPR